ncbi:hypothetical protein HRI_001217200 [Hibiscus trionum]|uniref:DUF3444 domain-containing protein n=1 Tax=Hibiscus trionum TaxID=183268 RepID=A0A9W7HDE0_HIBTR|nr:hypothetical protein HRI_001217200 [Hibiscus trionum]
MKLRIRIQEERVVGLEGNGDVGEIFWTACSRCRLLHKFERKYLGHNLVCPSCKKSFLAVEVDGEGTDGHGESTEEEDVLAFAVGERLKRKMEEKMDGPDGVGLEGAKGSGETSIRKTASGENLKEKECGDVDVGEWGVGRLRSRGSRRTKTVGQILAWSVAAKVGNDEMEERSKSKRVKLAEETMTLAEMQLEMKRKEKERERHEPKQDSLSKNEKPKASGKSTDFETENQGTSQASVNVGIMTRSTKKKSVDLEAKIQKGVKKNQNPEITKQGTSRKRVNLNIEKRRGSKSRDIEIVPVEDSDFYDFDKDRSERNFRKGQVWAIYDDDDGYGLIEEVFSVNPFEVSMSWLDFQNNVDGRLMGWKRLGFLVTCGRFKVGRRSSINSLDIFSNMVECESAAKEFYRIYPRKGSVWAVYNEVKVGVAGRNLSARDKHCYNIVVLLTTYTDIHGLSIAYLEKVDYFNIII